MEPVTVYIENKKKRSNVIWGMIFIAFGLFLVLGMIGLCLTEGFSFMYIFAALLFSMIIWVGLYHFQLNKYPICLMADEKGIHFYIYAGRIGFFQRKIVLPWDEIKSITQAVESIWDDKEEYEDRYEDEYVYEEILAIQINFKDERPATVIFLYDTYTPEISIAAITAKLNEMREFYRKEQK